MKQLYSLCIIGTILLAAAFFFWIDEPTTRYALIGSVLVTSSVFAFIVGRGMRRLRLIRDFMREHGRYLGFAYEGSGRSLDADGRVRGQLYCFRRQADREAWVGEEVEGEKRRQINPQKLPSKWTIFDGVTWEANEAATEDEVLHLNLPAATEEDADLDDDELTDDDTELLDDDAVAEADEEPADVADLEADDDDSVEDSVENSFDDSVESAVEDQPLTEPESEPESEPEPVRANDAVTDAVVDAVEDAVADEADDKAATADDQPAAAEDLSLLLDHSGASSVIDDQERR